MEQTEPAAADTRRPGMAPPITPDNAREMQARSQAARRANAERRRELEAAARATDRTIGKLETQLGEARAELLEAKADARAARAEAAAMRRRLEAAELARADAERKAAAGTPRSTDPADVLERAASGSVRTLSAVLGALATAARTGELWRSGADAAALLDAVVRAAAAVQALQDRASAAPARRRPAPIEAQAVDLGGVVAALRESMGSASSASSAGPAPR